jgi:ribosome-associated protein
MAKKKIPVYDEIVQTVIAGIQEKKGKQIVVIDLRKNEGTICDAFIICHGDSSRQVDAIADSVLRFAWEKLRMRSHHIEGLENLQWVLVDLEGIVVHIFQKQFREFYQLEELWSDNHTVTLADVY